MMEATGYEGGGLGRNEQGIREPVGTGRTRRSRAPVKPTERHKDIVVIIDKESIRFGKKEDVGIREVEISVRGRPQATNRFIPVDADQLYAPAIWGDGVNEMQAEASFPLPQEWTFRHSQTPIDRHTVKSLTELFALQQRVTPSCVSRWEEILGTVKWEQVQSRYSNAFLTPKDWILHFRHILHRGFYTKVKQRLQDTSCRLCGKHTERIEHYGSCEALESLRAWIEDLTKEEGWRENATFLLGFHNHEPPRAGPASLWLLTWGAIIRKMVQMSTEGEPWDANWVKKQTLRRLIERASSLEHIAVMAKCKRTSRGKPPPRDYPKLSRLIAPMGEVTADTRIRWSATLISELEQHDLRHLISEGAGGDRTSNSDAPDPNRNLIDFVPARGT
jgi:hypothetical protein